MFSQLGPLFKTQFRQTEANDTRQHIPHEEHDAAKKKEQDDKNKKETPKWEDEATVSVTSLRLFLIDFLKTLPDSKNEDLDLLKQPQETQARPHEPQRPSNTKNAKAVRAYQTMAKHAAPEDKPQDPSNETPKKIPDTIQSKEYRDIYQLIQDLDRLAQANVVDLHIFKSETFVESLKAAVDKEKKRLRF